MFLENFELFFENFRKSDTDEKFLRVFGTKFGGFHENFWDTCSWKGQLESFKLESLKLERTD